jgi:hypothetical protein
VNVGDGDPKTCIVDDLEVVTWKRAGERRHIVRIRSVRTGDAVGRQQLSVAVWEIIGWRLRQLRIQDTLA